MSIFVRLKSPYNFKALQELNSELESYGIDSYQFDFSRQYEYDSLPWLQLCTHEQKAMRRLKTIAIELEYNPLWTPGEESLFVDQPILMDLVTEVYGGEKSHFVWQYGFNNDFIPVDFTCGNLAKGCLKTLGSSINLAHELEELAAKLNFEVKKYKPKYRSDCHLYCDDDFDNLTNNVLVDEKCLLLELYIIALSSIENNLIMCIG
ncbi:MAG: hypothetical protein ACRC80_12830 [Waterburya sp.]